MIIDTHTHIDNEAYFNDLDSVIKEACNDGVSKMIIPGADINDLARAKEITQNYENVYMSVGMHPYHHDQYNEKIFQEYANNDKCVALGECGLDYFRLPENIDEKHKEKESQKQVFINQIKLASKYEKPLIVHIREANEDSLNILKKHHSSSKGGVLHCFNASESLLDLSDYGFYFGIGGVLTFKNAKKLVEVLPKIPLDKLVIETDAPYLTPHPHRGSRNEPKYTRLVVQKVAEILNKSEQEIEEITTANANELFFS
ncbi:MAG: Putative deoxyribonuclease YcfH [uncultured Campylobacterales bacterium]|uniref:Deoxyribonuclease YcfH n=1 Tax=uncultured Campylobacterales bacterium TaxID=352960 RepID=A0A6S6SMC8_9BACT|nr:MAG: Putative deoxyribonuclease YcfH [uncultured Campylobacterales bacterium]